MCPTAILAAQLTPTDSQIKLAYQIAAYLKLGLLKGFDKDIAYAIYYITARHSCQQPIKSVESGRSTCRLQSIELLGYFIE